MTDEEMAEEYVIANTGFNLKEPLGKIAMRVYLAGLKAGRPEWHDLRKDPNDLPKKGKSVLCYFVINRFAIMDLRNDNLWYGDGYCGFDTSEIIAWCEIPTFTDKE